MKKNVTSQRDRGRQLNDKDFLGSCCENKFAKVAFNRVTGAKVRQHIENFFTISFILLNILFLLEQFLRNSASKDPSPPVTTDNCLHYLWQKRIFGKVEIKAGFFLDLKRKEKQKTSASPSLS